MPKFYFSALLFFLFSFSIIAQDGSLDNSFNSGSGIGSLGFLPPSISTLLLQPDGKVLIGGDFLSYNGVIQYNIARLNGDGSLDTSFNSGAGKGYSVSAMALQPDGKILVVGYFSYPRYGIIRLNTDGSLDNTFNLGTGFGDKYSSVEAVALQPDGKILIGGYFRSYNGVIQNHIARLNTDGSLDNTFNSGTGVGDVSYIYAITLQPNGKILIGGDFSSYNGISRSGIARLNVDGSLDTSFNLDSGIGGNSNNVYPSIRTITLQPNGKILIGGSFISYNGSNRSGIARLNTDGTLDNTFSVNIEAAVYKVIALQPNGKILTERLIRFNSDGSIDNTFTYATEGNNIGVSALAFQLDGKVLVGGSFTSYNGVSRNGIVRLQNKNFNCPEISLPLDRFETATINRPFSFTFIISNGLTPYSFNVTSGSLPQGVSLSQTGVLSGTPTQSGTYTFTVQATDANGCTGTQTYSLFINPANNSNLLPNGTVGSSYLYYLNTGSSVYRTYTLANGSLPTGLSLEGTYAAIYGNPQVSGSYTFSLTGTDPQGNQTTQEYTIQVSCPDVNITSTLPNSTVGNSYLVNLATTGGSGSYLYAVSSGSLPIGLSLEGTYGAIFGSPQQAGTYHFTITSIDTKGCSTSKDFTVSISCSTMSITAALPNSTVGSSYLVNLTTTGNSGSVIYSLSAGNLPPGLSLEGTYAAVFGSPQQTGTYIFTLTSTDRTGCQVSKDFTVTIAPSGGRMAQNFVKGTNGESNETSIKLYPNPATDKVTIVAGQIKFVQVYDIMGRLLLEDKPSELQISEPEYDIKHLAAGTYFVKVVTNNQAQVIKFIKN